MIQKLVFIIIGFLLLITNSANADSVAAEISGKGGQWSVWQSYSKPVDSDGDKWIEIDFQTMITSGGTVFAKWRITNVSKYSLTRVSIASKSYGLASGNFEQASGGANSIVLAPRENYTFSPDVVDLEFDAIQSVFLKDEQFEFEFENPYNQETVRVNGNDFPGRTISMICEPYKSAPRTVQLTVEVINRKVLVMKDERGRNKTIRISDALRKGDRSAIRIIESELQAASKFFCGETITSASWSKAIVNKVMSYVDKDEIEAYKRCLIDKRKQGENKSEPNAPKKECIRGCMTKLCYFKRNIPDGVRG